MPDENISFETVTGSRERLTSISERGDLLYPWRRAEEFTGCFLYWMPVKTFPIPQAQREWLLEFLNRWSEFVKAETGLRAEFFLQYKTIYPDLMDNFLNTMMEFVPIMGLGRKPGEPLPENPSEKEIEHMTKSMFDALKRGDSAPAPDTKKYMLDYSYWFVEKSHQEQRKLFFGHGGSTLAFLKPDPKTKPPVVSISPALRQKIPVLQVFDLEKSMAQAASLGDSFQKRSKEMFAADLQTKPQMKGIPFVLPLLTTAHFLTQPDEFVKNCLEVFPVYLRETPEEQGVLLAFRADLEDGLIALLEEMRTQNLVYPLA